MDIFLGDPTEESGRVASYFRLFRKMSILILRNCASRTLRVLGS